MSYQLLRRLRVARRGRPLSGRPTPVDEQNGPGHEARRPGGQEHRRTDYLPRLPEAALWHPPHDVLVPLAVLHDLANERCGEVRRGQGIDLNVVRRELQREHLGELHNRPLARGVRALALHSDEAEDGGHVDDLASPVGDHEGGEGLGAVEQPFDVHVEYFGKLLRLQLEYGLASVDARDIDGHVHATRPRPGLLGGGAHALPVPDVYPYSRALSARLGDRAGRLSGPFEVNI